MKPALKVKPNIAGAVELMKTAMVLAGIKLLDGPYAKDFLVHDRERLETLAGCGMEFIWVVGDLHSHFYPVHIHEKAQSLVSYFASDSSRQDCFYLLKFDEKSGEPKLSSSDASQFRLLATQTLKYAVDISSDRLAFTVRRKSGVTIGDIFLKYTPINNRPSYEVKIQPRDGISDLDLQALLVHAEYAPCHAGQSLFVSYSFEWAVPVSGHDSNNRALLAA